VTARQACLQHYGDTPPRSACCGNTSTLELDHSDGAGNDHRGQIQTKLAIWLLAGVQAQMEHLQRTLQRLREHVQHLAPRSGQ
jgi:hypothetical protein